MHIDESGDASGNYSILGVKLMGNSNTNTSTYGLFPFGTFIARSNAGENGSQSFPVSENGERSFGRLRRKCLVKNSFVRGLFQGYSLGW